MIHLFKKAINYLKNTHVLIFVVFFFFLILLISDSAIAISNLYSDVSPFKGVDLSNLNDIQRLLVIVCIAPLLETAIFQYLIIKSVIHFTKNKVAAIGISAICFGLSHLYSVEYFITGVIAGLVLAVCFALSEFRKESSFILVTLVHALYNLYALIL